LAVAFVRALVPTKEFPALHGSLNLDVFDTPDVGCAHRVPLIKLALNGDSGVGGRIWTFSLDPWGICRGRKTVTVSDHIRTQYLRSYLLDEPIRRSKPVSELGESC